MVHLKPPFHLSSVGPTVRVPSVRRFAASLLPAGPPHALFSVGPTVRVPSVRRFAASLLPAGPPTPYLASGPPSGSTTPSLARLLAQMPIDQFFYELHALEFHDLRVLFLTAIEGHAHLPGPRKHIWIRDGDFVIEKVRCLGGKTFDHV